MPPTPDEDLLRKAPPARLEGVDVCRALDRTLVLQRADEAGLGTMVGHFSVFDEWYEIDSWFEGNFLERIAPGAFKRTIKNRSGETPVRVLLEHGFDPTVGDKPLGVHSVLDERDGGAYSEVPLLDTSYNRDLAPALAAGAYGKSFRFQVLVDEWDKKPEASDHNPRGIPERTIKEVRLIEEGPTVFPASPATNSSTGLRSTTDDFYERLRRRDPGAYDDALARSRSLRAPETPDADPAPGQPEDPPNRHSEDPPETEPAAPAAEAELEHSEDPPETHSEQAPPVSSSDTGRSSVMPETTSTMTIEERTARQSEIVARQQEIDAEFAGAELPEEARTEFDELEVEYEAHTRAIADAQDRAERIRNKASEPGTTERVRPTSTAPATRRPENIYDLSEVRREARSIDDLPQLYRDNAMRAVEQARFPGVEDRSAAQAHVEHLLDSVDDENGSLARRILVTGSPTYDRAFGKALAHKGTGGLTAEESRALSLGVNADGGFAVPFQLDPTVILTSGGVANPLRAISRVVQITGKEWQGLTTAGMTVGRAGEAAEADDDSPSFAQPTVRPTRVDAFVPFSIELDSDWARMRAELTTLLNDAKDTEEATSFISGNGTAPNPQGLLVGTTASQNVQPTTSSDYGSEDLYKVEESLPERWLANARWLAHRSFFNATRQLGSEDDGGNLWVRLGDGLPPELIGYPAHRQSAMPAFNPAAADGTVQAVLGDFRQFLIVDRVGMSIELVQHLFGENQRPTGQRGIFAIWRNSCKVLVPGAFRRLVTFDGT